MILVSATVASRAGSDRPAGPVTFDDIMNMASVGVPEISPDGSSVLFTVRGWEKGENERKDARAHVWRVATSGLAPARQLTFSERGESAPAWSPDGTSIGFLSARGASSGDEEPKPQIWVMRARGGEAHRLTDAKEGISAYAWSPDAKRIAFITAEALSAAAEARRKRRDDAQVFEGDFKYAHLWVVDIDRESATQVTGGTRFTIRGDPAWSPDGLRIAFAAAPSAIVRDVREDVYIATLGTKVIEKITTNPGPDSSPAWSPDGSTIAFTSVLNTSTPKGDGIPLQAVGNSHLMLYDVARQTIKDASTPEFDLSSQSPTWSPDARRVLFATGFHTYHDMFAYDVSTGRYAQLTKGRNIAFGSISRDGRLVAFTRDSATEPRDVYVADPQFATPRKLTAVNPQAASFLLGDTDLLTWTSDGMEVEGVLLKPVGFQSGRRYPLLVVAHGGPTGAHVNGFKVGYGDGGQHWAGQGWAVLYPNPRGSTNYGERFTRANFGDWGGGDYRDIMAGVDAVVERGIADPDKLAFQGWSYGGYLTCWVVSQTSRFKAAMMGAGLSNLVSMYGTTDIPDYLGTFFNGIPSRETMALYNDRSGLTFADRVTTPLLILHGGGDERVPIGQPMEFYRALKDRGKTAELVFYPREGHGFSEYYHQLDRLKRQYEWITKYTLGDSRKTTTQ